MARVYLGLGSNLGERAGTLRRAVRALADRLTLGAVSPLYETAPVGYTDQPWFLNAVVQGETTLAPASLLRALKAIEHALGRQPTFRYGPRVVDLDLLLYDDLVCASEEVVVPHPRLHERAFVLRPLADLAPDLVVPGHDATVATLLARLGPARHGAVRPYDDAWWAARLAGE